MTITTVSCIPISKHQPLVKEKKTSHPAKLLQNFRRPIHTGEFLFILEKYFLSAPVWRTMILFSKFCWLTPKFKSATTYRLSQSRSLLVGQSRRERVHSAPNVCGSNFFPVVIMQTAFWKSTRSIKPYASEVKREICLECTGGMHTPSKWAEMVILFCSKFCISCSEYAFSEERNREWFSWN